MVVLIAFVVGLLDLGVDVDVLAEKNVFSPVKLLRSTIKRCGVSSLKVNCS